MTSFRKTLLLSSLTTLACSAPLLSQAQDIPEGRYFAPGLSYHMFGNSLYDDNIDVKDEGGYGIAFGYRFGSPWAVELVYNKSETEYTIGNKEGDADSKYPHLDVLYHYASKDKITPYGVVGVGQRKIDASSFKNSDVNVNMGVGMAYALDDNFHLRSDVRLLLADDATEFDGLFNLGLVFSFGKPNYTHSKHKKDVPVENRQAAEESAPLDSESDPAADSDNDGVSNGLDQCPDTSAGAKVDEKGCYESLAEKVSFNLEVKFKTGSSELDESSSSSIKELADFLASYPNATTVIEGHTDSQGAAEFNKKLSQQRADSVMKSLINDFGVDASRVSAKGYGEEKPVADNGSADGRAQNRRVVAEVGEQTKAQ